LCKFSYKCIKFLGLVDPRFLKIGLPKYDYKFYYRINKADFITREEESLRRPRVG
jgi:hypothetical protein